jgi:hypothetical protein
LSKIKQNKSHSKLLPCIVLYCIEQDQAKQISLKIIALHCIEQDQAKQISLKIIALHCIALYGTSLYCVTKKKQLRRLQYRALQDPEAVDEQQHELFRRCRWVQIQSAGGH